MVLRLLGIAIASLWLSLPSIDKACAKPHRVVTSQKPVFVPQIGNFKGISSIAYSSDGKTLATVSEDYGPLLLWDARTLELKRALHGEGTGRQVQFTPDPNILAIETRDNNSFDPNAFSSIVTHLLDVRSGRIIRRIPAARYLDNGRILARYRDSRVIVSTVQDGRMSERHIKGRVTFSQAKSGRKVLTLTLPQHIDLNSTVFYFSPNHKRVALTTGAEVQIFDAPRTRPWLTLRPAPDKLGKLLGVYGPVAFSPDGKLIATGGADAHLHLPGDRDGGSIESLHSHEVKIWDARTGRLRRVLPTADYKLGEGLSAVELLQFSADSRRLIVGVGSDFALLDTRTFRMLGRTEGSPPFAIAPNGVHLLSGGYYGGHHYATLFDLRTGKEIKNLPAALGVIGVYAWSKDGKWLMVGDKYRNEVRLWNVREGKSGPSWKRHNPILGGFLPDGNLWTADLHEAEIRDPKTGNLIDSFKTPAKGNGGSLGISVSPDGNFFVTQRYVTNSPIELYDRKTKKMVLSLDKPRLEIQSAAFSPNGQMFAAVAIPAFKPSLLYVWNRQGELLHTFSDENHKDTLYIYGLRFSPDGKQLYASGTRGPRVYDLATGEKRALNLKTPASFDFSVDGQWRVSSSHNLTEIRDARSDQVVRRFTAPTYFDQKAALSPDKKLLARAEGGRTILYEVATGRKIMTLVSLPIHDENKAPTDWLIYTPEGFYNASPGATAQIRWRIGDTLYPAARFQSRFQQSARLKAAIAAAQSLAVRAIASRMRHADATATESGLHVP